MRFTFRFPLLLFVRTALLIACTVLPLLNTARAQKLSAAPTQPASLEDRRKALASVVDDYWQDWLKHDPEFASSIGDKRYNSQISDYSVAAVNDKLAREQTYLLRLAAIDTTGFTQQESFTHELLLRRLMQDQEAAEFKEWEMPVNQMGGIYSTYPQLAAQLNFATIQDYDDWIARLHRIPAAFAQVTTDMSLGIEEKRTPPRMLMEKALPQVQQLAAQKPEDSPLALPLKKIPISIPAAEQDRIKAEMLDAISKEILPAYQRFARFLEVTYIPACRTEAGLSALPNGDRYYQFLIRRTTTTGLTAAEIHQIGLDEVKNDEAQMLAIAQKLGFQDLATFRASLKTNPKLHGATPAQLLDDYRAVLAPMRERLPQLFNTLPKAKFEVGAVPDYLEKTAPFAYYEPGTPDGSRPGRLYIDTYESANRNLYQVEATAYHEGIPGHHLQISIARELTGIPEFRKYFGYTAYTEGWALYAEQLGKDAGFYQDPYSDYGRLENDVFRAIRLVVDTGVHSQHWTRDQMVQYFHDHSGMDEATIQAEVDRYIAWPGQALAYKIGQLEILQLREKARKALGDKFDIRAFDDKVVGSGALPLDLLAKLIDAWIAQVAPAASSPAGSPKSTPQ